MLPSTTTHHHRKKSTTTHHHTPSVKVNSSEKVFYEKSMKICYSDVKLRMIKNILNN